MLSDAQFLASIWRAFVWTVSSILGMAALGLPAAFLLNTQSRGKTLLKSCILIPWALPEIVTGYTWKWMPMGDFGIVNTILSWFHIVEPSFPRFRSGETAMLAVVIAHAWRSIPFVAVTVTRSCAPSPPRCWKRRASMARAAQSFCAISRSSA